MDSPPSSLDRFAAFTDDPAGGNLAGVWVGDTLPEPAEMQRTAAEVGYSETAFLAPDERGPSSGSGSRGPEALSEARTTRYRTRYFSPAAEVSFCGHATIASGVLLGERHGAGAFVLDTSVGEVPVVVERRDGRLVASLTSAEPRHRTPDDALLQEVLATLRWRRRELDPTIPPAVAWAGARHLVLALRERETLDAMEYDFERLRPAMLDADLTTLQLVWREHPGLFHARDPFPVGGVVEDPATGAAAAALGGYLRDAGLLEAPARFLVRQGEAMGRPSRIEVDVPTRGGITVSGGAVRL